MYGVSSPSETAAPLPASIRDRDLQRVDGAARVAVTCAGGRAALTDLYQRSPGKVLFPRVDGEQWREAVFLNTAGGVAGGDCLSYEARADGEAVLTVTTQAAERIYRAIDSAARIETRIEAADTAFLEWLPQETILFDGGRLARSTEIHIGAQARVLAMDWLILGRAASGERVGQGDVRDTWRLYRDGRLVWADAFRLGGDIAALGRAKPLLADCTAIATIIYTAPDAPSQIDAARDALGGAAMAHNGATVVNGLIICRMAAEQASDLRRAVVNFLSAFRGRLREKPISLPKVWTC
jgi:urease accessory protein